jgi:hypothetical protein
MVSTLVDKGERGEKNYLKVVEDCGGEEAHKWKQFGLSSLDPQQVTLLATSPRQGG